MTVDTSVIGAKTGAWRVTVERAPVANFARVLGDKNPVLADTPAPPTFSFVMAYWGAYADDQPPDPTGGTNPMHRIMGELFAKGALVLHGEQEFEYLHPVYAGDSLTGQGRISNVEKRPGKRGGEMTLVTMETEYKNQRGEVCMVSRSTIIETAKPVEKKD